MRETTAGTREQYPVAESNSAPETTCFELQHTEPQYTEIVTLALSTLFLEAEDWRIWGRYLYQQPSAQLAVIQMSW